MSERDAKFHRRRSGRFGGTETFFANDFTFGPLLSDSTSVSLYDVQCTLWGLKCKISNANLAEEPRSKAPQPGLVSSPTNNRFWLINLCDKNAFTLAVWIIPKFNKVLLLHDRVHTSVSCSSGAFQELQMSRKLWSKRLSGAPKRFPEHSELLTASKA